MSHPAEGGADTKFKNQAVAGANVRHDLHTKTAPGDNSLETPDSGEDVSTTEERGEVITKEFPESVFINGFEKWLFVVVVSVTSWISTVSIPIYLPTLNVLADYFNQSASAINVTSTIYSIFQGISPVFWAPLSDVWGRRPVYMCCAVIYAAANIALALCDTYGKLLGLRILQAFGGASTVSLLGGVIGDITSRRNRGKLVGVGQGISSLGNCFAPLAGAGIDTQFMWRANFWSLSILSGIVFCLVFFLLPETNRCLVGNGSREPPKAWKFYLSRSIYVKIRRRLTGLPVSRTDHEFEKQWICPPKEVKWFRWTHMLFQPRVFMVLIPTAMHYTTWYMVLTAQSTVLSQNYGFSTLKIGYTFLASGIGTLVASVGAGQLMQYAYKQEARYTPVDIYRARMGYSFHASGLLVASTLVFGWTLDAHKTFYVPVVMTFFVSAGNSFLMSTMSAILVDLFPGDSAGSQSCLNIARCLLCACGLAALQSMMDGMTIGGTFTLMAGFCVLSMGLVWYVMARHGFRRSEQIFVTKN